MAGVLNAEGDVQGAVEMDRRAMARVGGPKTFGLARTVITLYHMGLIDEALSGHFRRLKMREHRRIQTSASTPFSTWPSASQARAATGVM